MEVHTESAESRLISGDDSSLPSYEGCGLLAPLESSDAPQHQDQHLLSDGSVDEQLAMICVSMKTLASNNEPDGRFLFLLKLIQEIAMQKDKGHELFITVGYLLLNTNVDNMANFYYSRYPEEIKIDGAESDPVFHSKNICPSGFHYLNSGEYCVKADQYRRIIIKLRGIEAQWAENEEKDNENPLLKPLQLSFQEKEKALEDARSKVEKADVVTKLYESYAEFREFVALADECFSTTGGKFKYTACMMRDIAQCEQHDDDNANCNNEVSLGKFKSISSGSFSGGKSIIKMTFDEGTHCHAFGPRTSDLFITCGAENKLLGASEPSTCYYQLNMESPAACSSDFAVLVGIQNFISE